MSDKTRLSTPARAGGTDEWIGAPGKRVMKRIRPRGRPVDVMSGLSGLWLAGGRAARDRRVTIAGDRLRIYPEKRTIELALAQAVAATIHQNILAGRNPSGRRGKALKPSTVKERGGGPRGVRTGAMVSSIRVEERADHAAVVMDQRTPGQFWRAFRGARWTYNPNQPMIRATLEAILEMLAPSGEK